MNPDLRKFRNQLAILNSIDGDEFMRATGLDEIRWRGFRENPWRVFLTLSDTSANGLWLVIERKSSPPVVPVPRRTVQEAINGGGR